MKNLLILSLLSLAIPSYGQDISGCETVSLESAADIKASETCILKLADYALDQPMTGSGEEAHFARKVVIAWVEATPDYTYNLTNEVMKMFKGDNLPLFNIYLCCLAKASLDGESDFHKAALGLLVAYVEDPSHKVAQSKQVKKLARNWKDGDVAKYLF